MKIVSKSRCVLFCLVLWAIYAHATVLDMRSSVVYCAPSSKYCLGVKFLSKKLGDWGDDLSVDNFVYEKLNKFVISHVIRNLRTGQKNLNSYVPVPNVNGARAGAWVF